MRLQAFSVVAAIACTVFAQDLTQLPPCASKCVGTSLSTTGCGQLNVTCICASKDWISGLSCCVAQACSAADIDKTVKFAQNICLPAGVTIPSTVSCSTAGPSATGGTNATIQTTAKATSNAPSSASKTGSAAAQSSAAAPPTEQKLVMGLGVAAVAGLLAAVI